MLPPDEKVRNLAYPISQITWSRGLSKTRFKRWKKGFLSGSLGVKWGDHISIYMALLSFLNWSGKNRPWTGYIWHRQFPRMVINPIMHGILQEILALDWAKNKFSGSMAWLNSEEIPVLFPFLFLYTVIKKNNVPAANQENTNISYWSLILEDIQYDCILHESCEAQEQLLADLAYEWKDNFGPFHCLQERILIRRIWLDCGVAYVKRCWNRKLSLSCIPVFPGYLNTKGSSSATQ